MLALVAVALGHPGVGMAGDGRGPLTVGYAEHGDEVFFAIDYRPAAAGTSRPRDLVIALDTSRSLAGEPFARARSTIGGLRARWSGEGRIRLVSGDYRSRRCKGSLTRCLEALEPGGASDLGRLLDTAIAEARALSGPTSILLISDGRPSLGVRRADALIRAARRRIGGRDIAVHTARVGEDSNPQLLARLADELAGLFRDDADADALARALASAVVADVSVSATAGDVLEVVGNDSHNFLARDGFVVLGKLVSDTARIRLRGGLRTQAGNRVPERVIDRVIDRVVTLDPRGKRRDPDLVERWARLAIAEIEDQQPDNWKLIQHIEDTYLSPQPVVTSSSGTHSHLAKLGSRSIRVTCGGFGRAPVRVRGSRTKSIIRRAVRAKQPTMRHCYERGLRRDWRLAGTIIAKFWLGPDGRVHDAHLASSELASASVENCVLAAVRTIEAPPVPGDTTWEHISFPFTFEPIAGDRKTVIALARDVEGHVAAGRLDRARALVDARARELAGSQLGASGLLALLRSDAARAAFPAHYDRAVRARLSEPATPMELVRESLGHFARVAPDEVARLYGPVWVDQHTGAHALRLLGARQRPDLARALGRAWLGALGARAVYDMVRTSYSQRANDDQLRYEVTDQLLSASDDRSEVMDDFLASAQALGANRQARARVLRRCRTLDGQKAECTSWLGRYGQHREVRQRLAELYRPVVAAELQRRRDEPESHYGDRELAEALAYVGDIPAAVRVLSEQLELYPYDPDMEYEFAVGLLRLGQTDSACTHLRRLARAHADTDERTYMAGAYQDAWQRPAPASLCQ